MSETDVLLGIGNWVGDEVLYHAKLHPEQYCDEFSDAQIKKLHESVVYVCQTAIDKLADSDEFPDHWLFNHRWGKGSKDAATALPNGEKLAFITVGGRTSCYAPNVQKKTGHVAPGIKEESVDGASKSKKGSRSKKTEDTKEPAAANEEGSKPKRSTKSRKKETAEPAADEADSKPKRSTKSRKKEPAEPAVEEEPKQKGKSSKKGPAEPAVEEPKPKGRSRKKKAEIAPEGEEPPAKKQRAQTNGSGTRRSARLSDGT